MFGGNSKLEVMQMTLVKICVWGGTNQNQKVMKTGKRFVGKKQAWEQKGITGWW